VEACLSAFELYLGADIQQRHWSVLFDRTSTTPTSDRQTLYFLTSHASVIRGPSRAFMLYGDCDTLNLAGCEPDALRLKFISFAQLTHTYSCGLNADPKQ
jgi:hypothetical protein